MPQLGLMIGARTCTRLVVEVGFVSDYPDFDFDSTQNQAWEEFSRRLDEVISVMDATADLTISVASTDDDAQRSGIRFSVIAPSLIAAYVLAAHATDAEKARLQDLGWNPPDGEHEQFHTVVDQEASADLARLATDTLSGVFCVLHPIFLEPDQLAEILKGESTWTPLAPRPLSKEETSIRPANQLELDGLVDEVLRRKFGHPPLRNEQGDVAIRVGSTMVFLRSTSDAAELMLFSPLVHDVSGRSRACEVLNDLNVESRFGRFALHRDRVYVQISVPAQPFVPAHLHQALRAVSQIADGIDDELASRLGGRTTFPAV